MNVESLAWITVKLYLSKSIEMIPNRNLSISTVSIFFDTNDGNPHSW